MLIKRLGVGDEALACELAKVFHQREVDEEQVRDFLSNGQNYVIAAYIEEVPVGILVAHELQRFDGLPSKVYLHEIGVEEEYRKRGIGRELLSKLQGSCPGQKIFLITDTDHTEAMRFYPGTGAKEIGNNNVLFEYGNE